MKRISMFLYFFVAMLCFVMADKEEVLVLSLKRGLYIMNGRKYSVR